MKYLFEDKADDDLSELFRLALPESIQPHIEYSNGNGNLVRRAEELLTEGETVVVILDTIPANKSIRDIYIFLRRLSRQHDYRLIVWNIVCTEYYFIKEFGRDDRLKAFKNRIDYETAINVMPYQSSSLIQTKEDRAFTKTFEKFCKLYISKNGGECIPSDSLFFEKDCGCDTDCEKETRKNKSKRYQNAYGFCIDQNSEAELLWDIHRELLKISNMAIETYNQAGCLNIKPYPVIR